MLWSLLALLPRVWGEVIDCSTTSGTITSCADGLCEFSCGAETSCTCKVNLSITESVLLTLRAMSGGVRIAQNTRNAAVLSVEADAHDSVSVTLDGLILQCRTDSVPDYINAYDTTNHTGSVTINLTNVTTDCASGSGTPLLSIDNSAGTGTITVNITDSTLDWASAAGDAGVFALNKGTLTLTDSVVRGGFTSTGTPQAQLLSGTGSTVTLSNSVLRPVEDGAGAPLIALAGASTLVLENTWLTAGADSTTTSLLSLTDTTATVKNTLLTGSDADGLTSLVDLGGQELSLTQVTLLGGSGQRGVNHTAGELNLSGVVFAGVQTTPLAPTSATGSFTDQSGGPSSLTQLDPLGLASLEDALAEHSWSAWADPDKPTACHPEDTSMCLHELALWPTLCSGLVSYDDTSKSLSLAGFQGAATGAWWASELDYPEDFLLALLEPEWACPANEQDEDLCYGETGLRFCGDSDISLDPNSSDPLCVQHDKVGKGGVAGFCDPDSPDPCDSGSDTACEEPCDPDTDPDCDPQQDSGSLTPYKPAGWGCGERAEAAALLLPGGILLLGLRRRRR